MQDVRVVLFLKYFFIFVKKFGNGYKRQMTLLFLMSVVGGFLELLGIAMIFPVMLILTSSDSIGGKTVLEFCSKFLPNLPYLKIAFILSLIMIFVFLFKNLFMMYYIKKQNDFVKIWSDYINENVIKKILYAPYKQIKTLSYGDENTLLFSSVRDISLEFVLRTIILLANGVVALCILGLLFYKFTIPAFLSTAFIVLFAFFENLYFKKKAAHLGEVGVKMLNDFAYDVNFIINSQKEIIISNKQEYFANYLMKSSKNISDNFSKRISFGNYPLYVTEIGVIISFLIMIISIVFLSDISKAAIISSLAVIALIVLRLVPQLNKVLISMYAINVSMPKAKWFIEKYDEISKFNFEEYKNLPSLNFESEIELKDVSFEYEENKGLKNINLKIKKGEFVGIIGASGAGKTTLADIIAGVYEPNEGLIFIDNVELTKDKIKGWQKNISFLPQESSFLNASVLKNVAFGIDDNKINLKKAQDALKKAGLNIPLNSTMDLSIGQKKRVALARAYYNDFKLLILDEATSSLDVETENFVSENVANLKGEKTIIAIAHRLSTLKKCDRIIYLEEGKIKDEGTFDKLKEKHKEIENILKLSSF